MEVKGSQGRRSQGRFAGSPEAALICFRARIEGERESKKKSF